MSNGTSLLWGGAAIAALVGTVLGGCGGVGPGDYVVYRVSFSEIEQASSCYPDKYVPPDVRSDSSTLRASGTYILYAGAEDKFYLDTGDSTLEGTQDGDKYTFEGKAVDVDYDTPDGQGNKRTSTLTTTIEMTVDGDVVTGTAKTKTSYKCSGQTCGNPIPSCTESGDFVGTQVDDLKLKHDVK
jgi:hypothetical protein